MDEPAGAVPLGQLGQLVELAARVAAQPGATMPRTAPPASIAQLKTRKSTPRTASVRSVSSSPKRMSGLSEPYRASASS